MDIITITKDDFLGLSSTIESTRPLRTQPGVRQIIVDSSGGQIRKQVEQILEGEENVEYIWSEPSGIAGAFNRGIDASRAQWVWFLNGGDTFHPGMDCTVFLSILRNSSADAVIFQMEGRQSHTKHPHPPLWALWPPVNSWIPHPAMVLKRQLFADHGYFDREYRISMDYEMWLRMFSEDVSVDLISIPVVVYDESGSSSTRLKESAREALKILRSKRGMLLNRWLENGRMILRAVRYYRRVGKSG